jgi:hypothetical protein
MTGGDIVISGGLLNTAGGTLLLAPGDLPAAVKPTHAGTDVIASELSFASALEIAIDGPGVDTQYNQLNVNGQVNLTGVHLVISGDHEPAASDSFVIVNNNGDNPIIGEFVGLPEGTPVTINGGTHQKRITYVGGDGNDVELVGLPPSTPVDADGTTNSVPENSPAGTPVGLTAQSDTDPPGGALIYSLLDNAGGRFAIDSVTGIVTVANGGLLNYESATSHSITVTASDGDLSTNVVFLIEVTNVAPFAPFDFNDGAANEVLENAANGTAVGLTVLAFDPAGGLVTYSLSDDAGGRFAIDSSTGIVTVLDGSLLNYESSTSHSITVVASDGLLTSSESFSIAILNAPPSVPVDSDPALNSVPENAANGTPVGLTANSTDPAGGAITYSLSDDAGGRFAIDSSTGVVTVLDGTLLDYESDTSHTITVVASDGLLTTSQSFLIAVENVNEALTLDVQQGQTQRSYVRTVDLVFESDDGLDDVVNLALNRIQLERFALSGAGPATLVNLAGAVSRTGSQVELDFGVQGIGGNRNTTAGNGYYRLSVDVDGDGIFETVQHFYRLLGDVNGDRQVSAVDANLILAAYGSSNPERDVNGDGLVNSIDRTLAIRSLGLALDADLPLDD